MNIGFEITKNLNELINLSKEKKIIPKIHNSLLDTLGVGSKP